MLKRCFSDLNGTLTRGTKRFEHQEYRYLRSEQLIVSYDAQIVGKKWQALSRTFSGGDIMNSENESIRANPGASPDRPIKKSGGGVLQDSINASPVRRRQAKQDSQLISEHLLHDSSPAPPADSLSQTKLPGGLQQPLLSPNDPEALLEEHLLDENAADSPGTPEQLDAAQLGSAFTSAWVDSASLQHEAHAGGAEQSIPGVHDSARSEQPSDVRQTANLARVEASPQPQVSLAVPSPHDTPDGALVAGVSTPDHPDDAAVRGSFASVIAGEDSFAEGLAADLPTKEEAAGNADVAAAELADVALMWQTVEQESRLRRHRRARTSVTSLRSSGALEALLEDVKWQREAADSQLASARREKAAADEMVQHAGFEGFQIERGMLDRLQTALTSAAAAESDKQQIGDELEAAFQRIAAAEMHRLRLEQQLQAEARVREATERALYAARHEVEALSAKARRAAKQRRRLLTRMEGISEAVQSPLITHGQSLRASLGGWPGGAAAADDSAAAASFRHVSAAAQQRPEPVQAARVPEAMALQTPGADMDELFGASSPAAAAHIGSHISAEWAIRSRGDAALATPSRERSSWGQAAGPSSFNSPASWMRMPSQTGPGSAPRSTDERRQRAREAHAEALALEYDRAADSGYEEETDSGLTPSRLLLRLREARAAAAGAASGARRARLGAAAAEARAAAAEAAEARMSAALTAAQQRSNAREEHARRLQAQLGQAQLRLAQLRMQCDSTAKTLSGRSQALNTSKAELKDWEAKAAELQKQVEEARGAAERATAEALAAQERCSELEHAAVGREAAVQDAAVQVEEARAAQAARAGQAQQILEQMERMSEEKSSAVAALHSELQSAVQEQAALQADLHQHEQTAADLRSDLLRQETCRQELKAEVQRLTAAQGMLKDEAAEQRERERLLRADLQAQKADREERVTKLEAEVADLKRQTEELESASADLMDLRAAFKEREATITRLTAELETARGAKEGLAMAAEKEAVEEAAEQLRGEVARLRAALDASPEPAERSREERCVEDAENRLADAQIELMAAQYDARTAAEALTSAQERVSDLTWHLDDSHGRIAQLEASCTEATAAREAAEHRSAELEEQAARAQARAQSLAAKLKAHRRSSGESALLLQVETLQEDKRSAEAQAEGLRLKLATVRREAASREAELVEQAATSQAEAEAAAQLLAAMRPKGDNVLATLWTELMEAHARAAKAQLLRPHGSKVAAPSEAVDDEGAQKRLHELWGQLEAARNEAGDHKRELAVTQAQLAATTPKHGSPGGSPDCFNGEPKDSAAAENGDPSQGQHSSGSHGSPPESPEAAAAQGSFHMDESPIRGLLTDGARAAARRAERLTAAAAAREAAAAAVAAAAAAPEAATGAAGAAPEAAAGEAGAAAATGKRTGKWTPRGSGIMPAAPTASGWQLPGGGR
ncbi:hypothetical protein WJX75_006826 [Coccomyxa subellipsoidea]|uniref:Uncharacterized protein n=1 Tax=Coccomyxa subellipsoidea TaxID=248742 RepID=A0ABR2YMR0_9CHLO